MERFKSFDVILVEPAESLNVGAVARAMMNLGFSRLHLVAPEHYSLEEAARTACWARPLLEGAYQHSSLAEALAPMEDVVGFASPQGRRRRHNQMLQPWVEAVSGSCCLRTALVFGPERTGLRLEHIEQCRVLVRIPSTAENPSYNLAQAVLLVLYELSRRHWEEFQPPGSSSPAVWNDYYQLDRKLEFILEECGFFREGVPHTNGEVIKNLMRRMQPDQREMGIVLAMFDQIQGTLKRLKRQQ